MVSYCHLKNALVAELYCDLAKLAPKHLIVQSLFLRQSRCSNLRQIDMYLVSDFGRTYSNVQGQFQ